MFLSILKESFLFSLQSLFSNKVRTSLSLLGITIGIFSIIAVFTAIDALKDNVKGSIESLGTNVVFVQKWPWTFGDDYPWWKYMNRPLPTVQEMQEIQAKSQLAEAAVMVVNSSKTIKYGSNNIENASITAATYDYFKVRNFEIYEGRYFTESECSASKNVCIIGFDMALTLFPNEYAIGKEIKLLGRKLRVVGVFAKEGNSILGSSSDNLVLIPYQFARTIIDVKSERTDPSIYVKAKDNVTNADLKEELKYILRSKRLIKPLQTDNFALNETKMLSQGFDSLFVIINIAGIIIGGFSIIVGGFGISNIMFVSVKERTNQIGIQKALGAKNYFILLQFLIESILLSLLGGIIGLLLIAITAFAASKIFDLEIYLQLNNIFLGLTISFLIGVISGVVPSYQAAKLNPVDAIRQ
jgi:putative ABC transport system permease protein